MGNTITSTKLTTTQPRNSSTERHRVPPLQLQLLPSSPPTSPPPPLLLNHTLKKWKTNNKPPPPSQPPSPPLPPSGNPSPPLTPAESPPSAPPNSPSRANHKIPRKRFRSGYWICLLNCGICSRLSRRRMVFTGVLGICLGSMNRSLHYKLSGWSNCIRRLGRRMGMASTRIGRSYSSG